MDSHWYDEAYDADGVLRPHYASLRQRAGWNPLRPAAAVADKLRDRPLADDARILPIPLVIDDTEYRSIIQAGVAQRARALQCLFADLILGPQQILTAGIGLDRCLVDEILTIESTSLARLRDLWHNRDRDGVRFVYGPDLVRDADGRWTVLEDNVGCIGGSADGFFVADRYRTATSLPGCPACQREPDLVVAVRRWLHQLRLRPAPRVVAVLGWEAPANDLRALLVQENIRRRLILDTLGIPVINNGGRTDQTATSTDGLPTVLINFGMDQSSSDAFAGEDIAMLNAPGTSLLGNKALLPFADDVIRLYTGQEPILQTPPTRLLSDGVLPADTENWVVKTSAGCQGTEVVVLGWQPRDRLHLVENRLRREWSETATVAQRYVEPSRLTPAGPAGWDGYRLELRTVTYVLGWQNVFVGEQPVGKAISTYDAWRLNNISHGACYVPVLREPCPRCAGGA